MSQTLADEELSVPADETEEQYAYPVTVEDAGGSAKKVRVDVPRERIDKFLRRSAAEIGSEAALPGFRKGRAPRHLIEKRFGKMIRDQVQSDLLRESFQYAIESNNLNVIGEPEFEDAKSIRLPEEGDLTYTFTAEVVPEFTLPTLEHLSVKKVKIDIKDDHVDQAVQNLREQQGHLVPVEDRGVQEKDYLIADLTVSVDGERYAEQNDAELVARAGRVAGIQVDDFAQKLDGLKVGESRSFEVAVPAEHPESRLAGKTATVEVALKDLKSLELAELDGPFLESLGFETLDEVREALREQMVERVEADVQQHMRRQVLDYLLANTQIDVPPKLGDKQVERVISRRATDLMTRGMPREQILQNLEALRRGADEQAVRDLKTLFVLGKIAEERGIDVDEAEVNGQIAMIAANRNQRPETLKKQMQQDGSFADLHMHMREGRTLDVLLEGAKVEEIEASEQQKKDAVEGTDIT